MFRKGSQAVESPGYYFPVFENKGIVGASGVLVGSRHTAESGGCSQMSPRCPGPSAFRVSTKRKGACKEMMAPSRNMGDLLTHFTRIAVIATMFWKGDGLISSEGCKLISARRKAGGDIMARVRQYSDVNGNFFGSSTTTPIFACNAASTWERSAASQTA